MKYILRAVGCVGVLVWDLGLTGRKGKERDEVRSENTEYLI